MTGGVPAGLIIHGTGGALPAGGGEGQCGEALSGGPADEVAGVVVVGGRVVAQPLVEVGLAAACQCQVAGGEPVEQGDGGADALEYDGVLLVGGGAAIVATAQPPQQMPDGVAVDALPRRWVGLAGPAGGEGRGGAARSGSSREPDRMGFTWSQREQRAVRFWRGGHHGSPVSREVPLARCCPQIEHSATGSGGQPA